MTTGQQIVSRVVTMLHGWGQSQDRVTPLSQDIGPTDTTLTVDFAYGQSVGITPGVIEIGTELLYIQSVDPATGICTLTENGRGWAGTTAVAHPAGSSVASRPLWPRKEVMDEVNGVIRQLFPTIFQTKTYTGVVQFPSNTYTLGERAGTLIDVQWQDPWQNWQRCRAWQLDPYDGTVRILGAGLIGRPLRIIYTAEPETFTDESQDITDLGLSEGSVDILVFGAAARLVVGLDVGRLENTSIAASDNSKVIQPGQAVNASKYLMAEYQQALLSEQSTLAKLYRPKIRKVW